MPWSIEQRDGEWCVVKDSDGEVEGCHDSRTEAIRQQRALYASERRAVTAAIAPLKPPRSYFSIPEADKPTPLTYDEDGRVYGHLALWDSCHSGFMASCVKPPRSATDYLYFHVGEIETAEGDMLPVGKIVYSTDHASVGMGMQAASRHYADSGAVGAFVRATNGRFGPWLSGVIRSDLSPEGLRDLRANPLSGDWRPVNHNLELVAALAVPVPGFPIPRAQLALSASGEEVSALILPALTQDDIEEDDMDAGEFLAEKQEIDGEVEEALTAAVLTSKRRNALPRSAFALPEERAYPIMDLSHARNALARASGKPEEARVKRAVYRRYPALRD